AGELDHGTNAAARDHPGAVGRRSQQDRAGAEDAGDLEGDGAVRDRHGHEGLLCLLDALADGFRNFVRLAETVADVPRVVADDDRAEAEPPATLHDLGDAVDVHDLFFELESVGLDATYRSTRHKAPVRS